MPPPATCASASRADPAALLRTLGIYPPGTVVRLANREVAVVVRRGCINAPLAVAIPAGARTEAFALRLRDTAHAVFTIVGLAKSSESPFIPGVGEAFALTPESA